MSVRKAIAMSINTAKVYINDTEKDNYETSLKGIASSIRAKLNVLDKLDSKLICTCAEEEIDKETTDANNYQTNIYVCLSEIDTALERLREPIIPLSRTHSPSQFSTNSRFCSGLKGRRPFWLRNPRLRWVPSLLLLGFSFSGDEVVE